MQRPWIVLILVLGSVLNFAPAAPRPKDGPKPALYYPTTPGEQWVLGYEKNEGTDPTPLVVKSAVEKEGVTTVCVANVQKDGTAGSGFTVEVSEKGVCVIENPSGKLDMPHWLIKLPFKAGTKWENAVKDRDGKSSAMVYTVVKEEEVVTPTGTYLAIRVDSEYPAGTPWVTEWWAPGRGKIKQTGSSTLVLKSITPGTKPSK